MTSDAAKEVLAQEKESNQVIKVCADIPDIPAYSEYMDVTSFSSISYWSNSENCAQNLLRVGTSIP